MASPSISFPTFGDNQCSQVTVPNCQPWAAPAPDDLSWQSIVSNSARTVEGRSVGASYLCSLLPEPQVVGIVGPSPARVLTGSKCVMASTDGPRWVRAEQGTITARLAFTGRTDREMTGKLPEITDRTDTADRSHRSGVLRAPGADVRVTLDYDWPDPSGTLEERGITPAPKRVNDLWRELVSEVRGKVASKT
ncbi:hypothetical protein [Actinopolyspora alba]|uniref:hypothetical protein n=1 Tax=Actinopolyspora alba TaxID=673379 RepID=UPI00111465DC|nr:hypothetical protein [Actinopolyspora alba]